MIKILGGIVLYNPDIERLGQNIDAIFQQVDAVLCVDNGSSNITQVKEIFGDRVAIIELDDNLGIATALNKILLYAQENGFEWFITLDQDSVCLPGLIEEYKKYKCTEKAGIIACSIKDRNFEINSKKIEYIEEIDECITSASFCNTEALTKVGGFDNEMFIDSVDFELCLNLRKHGFKIYKIGFVGILHEVGHGKNVKLLWKNRVVYNHSPLRNYYMARNQYYMAKKYPADISMMRVRVKELERRLLIWLYEDNKTEKLRARRLGVKDGKRMKMGECTWL